MHSDREFNFTGAEVRADNVYLVMIVPCLGPIGVARYGSVIYLLFICIAVSRLM